MGQKREFLILSLTAFDTLCKDTERESEGVALGFIIQGYWFPSGSYTRLQLFEPPTINFSSLPSISSLSSLSPFPCTHECNLFSLYLPTCMDITCSILYITPYPGSTSILLFYFTAAFEKILLKLVFSVLSFNFPLKMIFFLLKSNRKFV